MSRECVSCCVKSLTLLRTQPPKCKTCVNKGFIKGTCRMLVTCHEPRERQRAEEVKKKREGRFAEQKRTVWEIRRRGNKLPHRRQMLACLYKHPRCPLDPRRRSIPPWFPPPSALGFPAGFHGPSANCDVPPARLHCARDPFSFQWQS